MKILSRQKVFTEDKVTGISMGFLNPFNRSGWALNKGFIIGKDNLFIANKHPGMVGGWEGLTVSLIQTLFFKILVWGSSGKGGGNWNIAVLNQL